jgi:hypothetical protein
MENLAGYPPQLRQDGERGMPNDLAAATFLQLSSAWLLE